MKKITLKTNRLINKLLTDLLSLKVWILFISVGFLASGAVSDTVWGSVVIAMLGMREVSELRQNIYGNENSD